MEGHVEAIRSASKLGLAPFWCGGSVELRKNVTVCSPDVTPAVTMKFPAAELQPLIELCEPATFGKDKQNVLDPSYRSALALGSDKFITSFDLAGYDVLHTIKTTIMPDTTSVRAELYKLNVYRPGDFFKAHVDTPRGNGMFGSLVVCLPQEHTGGNLVVRHHGAEHAFEFAKRSAEALQWAAFYSDCEHEIKPVESGYRVTLTYNLYVEDHAEPYLPGLSFEDFDLYNVLKQSLASDDFLPRGGKLVWAAQHCYPHTTDEYTSKIESMLKGTDALVFKALQQLGLHVEIQTLLDCPGKKSDDDDVYDDDGYSSYDDDREWEEDGELEEDRKLEDQQEKREKGTEFEEDACLGCLCGFFKDDDYYDNDDHDGSEGVCQNQHSSVIWITRGGRSLEQKAVLKYGNEYSISLEYISIVIVAKIPNLARRHGKTTISPVRPAGRHQNVRNNITSGSLPTVQGDRATSVGLRFAAFARFQDAGFGSGHQFPLAVPELAYGTAVAGQPQWEAAGAQVQFPALHPLLQQEQQRQHLGGSYGVQTQAEMPDPTLRLPSLHFERPVLGALPFGLDPAAQAVPPMFRQQQSGPAQQRAGGTLGTQTHLGADSTK